MTHELLKNARISDHLGRRAREVAQYELLHWLIEQGIAMDLYTFGKSYAN